MDDSRLCAVLIDCQRVRPKRTFADRSIDPPLKPAYGKPLKGWFAASRLTPTGSAAPEGRPVQVLPRNVSRVRHSGISISKLRICRREPPLPRAA
jgi:hypothetical protein